MSPQARVRCTGSTSACPRNGVRALLSHDAVAASLGDFFTTHETPRWEDYGFTYLFHEVLPWLRDRGIDDSVLDRVLVDNPRRLLAVKATSVSPPATRSATGRPV